MVVLLIAQVRGLSGAVSVIWVSSRSTCCSDMRRSTVVRFLAWIFHHLSAVLVHEIFVGVTYWDHHCCLIQEKSLLAVTSATCALSRSTIWSGTKGHTVARSHIAAIPANKYVTYHLTYYFLLDLCCIHVLTSVFEQCVLSSLVCRQLFLSVRSTLKSLIKPCLNRVKHFYLQYWNKLTLFWNCSYLSTWKAHIFPSVHF